MSSEALRRGFRFLVLPAAAWMAAGCASRPPAFLAGEHPQGVPRYRIELDSLGRRQGAERWWYPDGSPQSEATYHGGVRHGRYRAWHPNGSPWYEGRDSLGIPVDTLRIWHDNGVLQALNVFRDGQPVFLQEFDSSGVSFEELARRRREDSLRNARRDAMTEWTQRVRLAVEAYWQPPKQPSPRPLRAAAILRVHPSGTVLSVAWPDRSGSSDFDRHAARALARVKRLPPPPLEAGAEPLELRYEFAAQAPAPARRRLQLLDPERALEPEGGAETIPPP